MRSTDVLSLAIGISSANRSNGGCWHFSRLMAMNGSMQAFSLAATFVALKYPVSASSMSALPNDSGYAANYISKLTKDRPLNTFFGSAKFMWGAPLFHQGPRPFVALIQALDSVRFNRIRSRGPRAGSFPV